MRFLADMGVSLTTASYLRSLGHEVLHIRDEGLQRAKDSDILAKARSECRIVLTFDLDFGHLIAASGYSLPSTIIFRLRDETPKTVNERLLSVLTEQAETLLSGALILVETHRYRIRRLPIAQ